MAYFFGKNGSDAIFKAFSHICRVLNRYESKLLDAIAAAEAGAVITSIQAGQARDFVATARVVCAIFGLIASNSGF
jgi:hypothetical protein